MHAQKPKNQRKNKRLETAPFSYKLDGIQHKRMHQNIQEFLYMISSERITPYITYDATHMFSLKFLWQYAIKHL